MSSVSQTVFMLYDHYTLLSKGRTVRRPCSAAARWTPGTAYFAEMSSRDVRISKLRGHQNVRVQYFSRTVMNAEVICAMPAGFNSYTALMRFLLAFHMQRLALHVTSRQKGVEAFGCGPSQGF